MLKIILAALMLMLNLTTGEHSYERTEGGLPASGQSADDPAYTSRHASPAQSAAAAIAEPPGISGLELLKTEHSAAMAEWRVYQPKDNTRSGLEVYHTSNGGQTWNKAALPGHESSQRYTEEQIFISAPENADAAWIMVTGGPAAGLMDKKLFMTPDHGQSWIEESDLSTTVDGYVTGLTFKDSGHGWVSASYHGDDLVPLYRTEDGGKHWTLQTIEIPSGYNYGNVYAPAFHPDNPQTGTLTVEFHQDDTARLVTYTTHDGGQTWQMVHPLAAALDAGP